jgi:hypothetical protein
MRLAWTDPKAKLLTAFNILNARTLSFQSSHLGVFFLGLLNFGFL